MKVLFVCHRLPYPPNRGGKIRPFNMIRHLSRKHEVVVASLAHTEAELKEGLALRDHCYELLAEVVTNSSRWTRAGRALATNQPSSVAYFWSPRLRRRIEDAAARYRFDAVMVHCAFAAQYVLGIPANFRLLDFGDLDSGKWSDYRQFRGFPLCYGYGLEARKLRRYEKQLTKSFDYSTLTTQGELEEFKKLDVVIPSTVIPNGVDSSYFQPAPKPRNSRAIAFVGRIIVTVARPHARVFPRCIQGVNQSRRGQDAERLLLEGVDAVQGAAGVDLAVERIEGTHQVDAIAQAFHGDAVEGHVGAGLVASAGLGPSVGFGGGAAVGVAAGAGAQA